ncbi:MAG: NifU family protein [Candidatus Babeliaceae bacterium]
MTEHEIVQKIEEIMQEMRPSIQNDGGDIHFVSYQEGIVLVRLHGACVSCPMSFYTLKLGIEERLKEQIPAVREVQTVE